MRKLHRTLAFKLLTVSAVSICLLLAAAFGVVIYKVREATLALTLDQAKADAMARAESLNSKIAMFTGANISTADAIGRGVEAGFLDRKAVTLMLKGHIEKFNLVFGSWLQEAPNGFDGKPGPINTPEEGSGTTGIFSPYWTRKASGITYVPDSVDYEAEYYTKSANTLRTIATEPYVEVNANNVLMMSITSPVLKDGKLLGVVGIDLGLSGLSDSLKNERPFGTGRIYLLSEKGNWLTGPTPDSRMKPYAAERADDVMRAIKVGQALVIDSAVGADGEKVYRVVYPFRLAGGLQEKWTIVEDVPVSAITTIVNKQTAILTGSGLVILAGLIVALFLSVRHFIAKPTTLLLREVSRLSEGRYESAVAGRQRSDEIGALANALESFRHQLNEGRKLEQINKDQRAAADTERSRNEAERSQTSKEQHDVVTALGDGLAELSRGNLTYRISGGFPENYEVLKRYFNVAVSSLEETVAGVAESVSILNAGTSDINRSVGNLSKRTEYQAASLEETAAALNEITVKLNQNSNNTREAAKEVEGASADAERSSSIIVRTIAAMEAINDSSSRVANIVGVIDQIAFQTNLLALNAGVEAARAGEAGKGFAVVAQEVRELSQRSAIAAREIRELITRSEDQVRDGVGLVGQTGTVLVRIVDQVQSINGLIRHISETTKDQSLGLNAVNGAVGQMDSVTQQNAAMVEETSAASAMLEREAGNLRELVAQFKFGQRIADQHEVAAVA